MIVIYYVHKEILVHYDPTYIQGIWARNLGNSGLSSSDFKSRNQET